jgi:uncharacterized protein YceK
MSKKHLTALALATTVLAAGCGSSKSSTQATSTASSNQNASSTQTASTTQPTAAGPPLAAAALITKADLICARLNAIRASNKIKSAQEYVRVTSELSSDEQQALAEMAKLTPPASLAHTWDTMLAGYRTIATNIAIVSHDAATKNLATANALLTTSTNVQHSTAAVARGAGFKDCGKKL